MFSFIPVQECLLSWGKNRMHWKKVNILKWYTYLVSLWTKVNLPNCYTYLIWLNGWSKLFLAAGYKFLCLCMRAYFVRQNHGLLNRSKRDETGVILFHLWQEIPASIVNGWNPIWLETHYVYLDLKIALNVKLLIALSAKLPLFVPLCGC